MAKVTAKVGKEGTPIEVDYKPLDAKNVKELVTAFGEDVVTAHCKSSITVALQSMIRTMIKGEKSAEDIEKAVAEWKPGLKTPGKSKVEKAQDLLSGLTEEDRKALLKSLQNAA